MHGIIILDVYYNEVNLSDLHLVRQPSSSTAVSVLIHQADLWKKTELQKCDLLSSDLITVISYCPHCSEALTKVNRVIIVIFYAFMYHIYV